MKPDGGPAFPVNHPAYLLRDESDPTGERSLYRGAVVSHGLTLRDYFAAAALGGIMAFASAISPTDVASLAYLYADAMLAERDK